MNLLQPMQSLVDAGGPVIAVIMLVALLLWILLLERAWLIWAIYPALSRQRVARWRRRKEHRSIRAGWIRRQIISENTQCLRSSLPVIAGIIAVLPMLGLFGTVSGMVHIFDQVAINGSPDYMAEGIARATLPTLAGMINGIFGLAAYGMIKAQISPLVSQFTKELAL